MRASPQYHSCCSIKMVSLVKVLCAVVLVSCSSHVFASDINMKNHTEEAIQKAFTTSLQLETSNYSHSGRIFNGKNANIASYRYVVCLLENKSCECGASVITYYHALTAAHCVYPNPNISKVRMASLCSCVHLLLTLLLLYSLRCTEAVRRWAKVGSCFISVKS